VHAEIVGKTCRQKRNVFSTEAPVSSVEDRNRGEVEKSALKADLSARPCGLGRGDKKGPTILLTLLKACPFDRLRASSERS